ncbi:carbonyl reductase [NADPH] 1-like [Mizuhopecten yessoensis]|uniref:Carbonyl reductase [NADPH] 1 n=1 Tax=Mizuhopecten yessoensis TaxID=6573 RepID=A0A210Q5K4_MIZYE|nr:carbonyl reductase [NADPH] 1-like [Mizuhopecten yessoensis]OWF44032.1 Carbonyl reductase [NADPH] 1 [Mizuhopecten yessoensis]
MRTPISDKKVAIVTGASRGLGLAIVRGLCRTFRGHVYLTALNSEEAEDAISQLRWEGLDPKFYQLDITDKCQVEKLGEFLKNYYGNIDILVNNAGIAYTSKDVESFSTQAAMTCRTNFYGTLHVCKILFPLLRSHSRVVNISSNVAKIAMAMCSDQVRDRLTDSNLTMTELQQLIHSYVKATESGTQVEEGWPITPYAVSKIGITVMTFIQQREFHQNIRSDIRSDIVVNACCPGFISTAMTRHRGTASPDQGADTPLFLANLPMETTSPCGDYVMNREVQSWG